MVQARSSVAEHCFDVARVSGSIPLAPTIKTHNILTKRFNYPMALDANKKSIIIEGFRQSPQDTGSVDIQIALLTEKIKMLNDHLQANPKDFSSKRGLMDAVSRRRKYLRYLEKENLARYKTTIERLGLRK